MQTRLLIVAAAAFGIAAIAHAEPAKAPDGAASKSEISRKPVVLASADVTPQAPDAAQQTTPAPRKRAARVTTCRCGDPQPESEER